MQLRHRGPNIEKLTAKQDTEGLIEALSYAEHSKDTEDAKVAAANVVRSAVIALAQIGDPRAIGPLIQTFSENARGVFGYSADSAIGPQNLEPVALARFGPPAVEPLLTVLRQSTPRMRAIAAVALGLINDARAVPALIEAGEYPQQAIWALGRIGGDRPVLDVLVSALDSERSNVQRYATHGLGSGSCGPAAADALVERMERGDRSSALASIALCELGDPRGLAEVLSKGVEEAFVLLPIGRFDDPRARDLLMAQLESSYPGRRQSVGSDQRYLYAALGLAARHDPAAVRPLIDVMTSPEADRSIPWLSNPDTEATLAADALRELGPVASGQLEALANDSDPQIQAVASAVLAASTTAAP